MRYPCSLTLAALLAAPVLAAQTARTGPQVLTFLSSVDDTDQPYALYLPKNYAAGKKYPLVISLHGENSNHRLNLRRVFGRGNMLGETEAEATRYFPPLRDVDFIVASPLARGTLGYQGIPEKDVYDVLADVRIRFSVDDDRVYLTGLSMGGGGALWLGMTRPDVWAAIAAVCPAPPEEAMAFAPNALNLPVRLFHGSADALIPVILSRSWNDRLRELDTHVEFTEYPHGRHNSWDKAYENGAIFDWFAQFKRNPYPDRVRFVTDRYKYRRAYWVRMDALTPGKQASIDANFTALNTIDVVTRGLDAFSLEIATHPKYSSGRPLKLTIDGVRVPVGKGAVSFVRADNKWIQRMYRCGENEKRPGLEGPIRDAVADRHIYVYGTADSPADDVLEARKAMAARASEWGRVLLSLRVAADRDVSESDIRSSNLVLFGTKETNSLIAKLAARAPVELNAGAADYGLVYVYPNGEHYILVNSGLPWWTDVELMRGFSFRYLPGSYVLLSSLPDYVLFRGSLEHAVTEGFFDRHWKLPAPDAVKMRDTGAVKLNP
jgi:poly(3-hydroxybutyrate) depolymerase